jgi:hypothetical protein
MGLPQDPGRAGRPGSEGSGIDGVGDSEEGRNRPGAAAEPITTDGAPIAAASSIRPGLTTLLPTSPKGG